MTKDRWSSVWKKRSPNCSLPLIGHTFLAVQADGKAEVLVIGQGVWEDWSGGAEWEGTGGDTAWWRGASEIGELRGGQQ